MSVNVTASSSTITATADGTAVQAGVTSTTVSASSSGGIGPQGPQGPQGPPGEGVDVEWNDILNKPSTFPPDTTSLATVAVSGSYDDLTDQPTIPPEYVLPAASATTLGGVTVQSSDGFTPFASGRLAIAYGTSSTTACRGDDSRLSNARTPTSHVHGNISNAGAIGSTSGQIVVTTTAGVLTTAASISLSQISQSSATTGQVVAWNGTAWAPAAASGYTLPNATTSTLGGVIVGTGLGVTSGTVSVSFGTSSSTACVGNDARLSDSRTPLAHTHAIADVTNLQTTLDGKAASSHGHAIADVTGLQTALDGKQASGSYASATHAHAASDVTSGTFDIARIPTGSTSSTVCVGNDSRLSDARTPTSHSHALADLQQGGATTGQVIAWSGSAWAPATVSGGGGGSTSASDLTSGTLNDARLSFVPLHPFLLMGG